MKTHHTLVLAGAALIAMLFSSCAGPAFVEGGYSSRGYSSGYSGIYSGPYYGDYGPYNGGYGGEIIVGSRRYNGHYGDHHLYGQNFGRSSSNTRSFSGSGVRRGSSSKSHSSSRDRH